jgi:4-amino-4-deoxy-L-arabinose transferase-like glycosyltransferase
MHRMKPRAQSLVRVVAITSIVFFAALIPRIWVLDWGLPYVEHADEPHYVEVVVNMVRDGDPHPDFFRHPALIFYLMSMVTRAYGEWMIAGGHYESLLDLPQKTYAFTTSTGLYIWNRALIAALGALTVSLAFWVGRQMYGWRTAVTAAIFLLIARFHVEYSYYIATSGPTGLGTLLMLFGAWEVARRGSRRGYLLGAVGTGIAAGIKYNAGIVGMTLTAAALIYAWGRWRELLHVHLPRLVLAGILAIIVFFCTNPYALIDWNDFYADITAQSGFYNLGGGNFEGRWNIGGYAEFFWERGLGWIGTLVLLGGLPLLIRNRLRPTLLLIAPILIELGLLVSFKNHFVRNLLIIYPAIVILLAAAAVELSEWFGTVLTDRLKRPVSVNWLILPVLIGALITPQIRDTFWLLRYWSNPHTLVEAGERLRALPRGMLAAVEMRALQWAGDPAVEPVQWLGTHPPDWYRARGYRYLVVNSERYGPEDTDNYQRLFQDTTVLLAMPDRDLGLQPGPGGALLDLGQHIEAIPFIRNNVRFGDSLELLGYELRPGELRTRIAPLAGANEQRIPSGSPLQINLYWRTDASLTIDYVLFIHVYDEVGNRVAQRDLPLRYGDYPTSQWQPDELVIDRADMPLPALPAGSYRLEIGLYDAATGVALPIAGGTPAVLTTITIP